MTFGKKIKSIKDLKKSGSGGGSSFIKFIPKDGRLLVRFMTEPTGWLSFRSVYDPEVKRSFPVPDDPDMLGGDAGKDGSEFDRVNARYLAWCLIIDEDDGSETVAPVELPVTLKNTLITMFERRDTLMDRDYELLKSGSGKDNTTYTAAPEERIKRNLSKYELGELEDVLQGAYDHWVKLRSGEGDDESPRTKKASSGTSRAVRKRRRIDPDSVPAPRIASRRVAKKKAPAKKASAEITPRRRRRVR